jgi:uncharacterized cupredoxin-like copper-binding protein
MHPMKTKTNRAFLAVLPLLAIALSGLSAGTHAHEGAFSAGKPGNPKRPYKTVTVSMHEGEGKMYYAPERLEVKRGEQVKFVIKNEGLLAHEFILADTAANLKHAVLMQKYPDMEHDDPNGKTVQPSNTAEILWRFTKRGEFEYGCLIPGHREAGMTGKISVK